MMLQFSGYLVFSLIIEIAYERLSKIFPLFIMYELCCPHAISDLEVRLTKCL